MNCTEAGKLGGYARAKKLSAKRRKEISVEANLAKARKAFDCGEDGCGKCKVCKYLDFIDWAEGCAPSGSTIERNLVIEEYLANKAKSLRRPKKVKGTQ